MTGPHTEGRIPRLSHDEAVAAAADVGLPAYMCDLNIFRVLLHHRALAKVVHDLLTEMILRGRLDDRLRELCIMRVGWRTASGYEWAQHWDIARQFGVSEEDLVGVRRWRDHAAFGPAERSVLGATDEILADGALSAATWERCTSEVGGVEAMLELVTAVGAWQMISVLLRSAAVPLEDHLAPWPPDGTGP